METKTFKIMRITSIIFFLLLYFSVNAQKVLTVEDAVSIALKNNFDILVSRNDANIAKINNTVGNAGMLPTVNAIGSENYNLNNEHQKLSSGAENDYTALSSTNISAGAELSWTLYDGGKMFVTKNKLTELEALGEIQFKDMVLQTLYSVNAAYYDVVRQQQQLNSIKEALNYNRERVTIAQAGFNAGSLVKTDLLQSKIDLNVTMENLINQEFKIITTKKSLNLLLGQNSDTTFEITDTIPLNYSPNKTDLLQKLNASNSNILSFQKQIEINQLALKESKTSYLPMVNFNAGYYVSENNNSAGSVLQNRSSGPQIGGTVVIPIYSAGENKRKVSAAKIQVQSAEYNLQNIKLQVNTLLDNTFTEFENQQRLLQIEKENNELTKENIQISLDRLRLGETTSLEVHLAQEEYVQSCTRLINFKYNLKIAETKLKQLVSDL